MLSLIVVVSWFYARDVFPLKNFDLYFSILSVFWCCANYPVSQCYFPTFRRFFHNNVFK